ncbi:hypothetical protein GCM10027037_14780 [Mucilaginibacter koreensis]
MKYLSLCILALSIVINVKAQSNGQNKLYGPLPYRELKKTIGETYIVLPTGGYSSPVSYVIHKADEPRKPILFKELIGKKMKLLSIDDRNGHFQDSLGVEYLCFISDGSFPEIAPLKDIEDAKNLLVGKTLWLNKDKASASASSERILSGEVELNRFEPVKVVAVSMGGNNNFPVIITFKTRTGKQAVMMADISGTNTQHMSGYLFNNIFFTQDPKTLYHFTPAIWEAVKNMSTPKGMPADAFELVIGKPDHINSSQVGHTSRQQWVYGKDNKLFFYFENGKYTGNRN